jgi:hypothetical protein
MPPLGATVGDVTVSWDATVESVVEPTVVSCSGDVTVVVCGVALAVAVVVEPCEAAEVTVVVVCADPAGVAVAVVPTEPAGVVAVAATVEPAGVLVVGVAAAPSELVDEVAVELLEVVDGALDCDAPEAELEPAVE